MSTSEQMQELHAEITRATELPLAEQAAAFEMIRSKLESMIADSETKSEDPE
jgi:hypothetical protein